MRGSYLPKRKKKSPVGFEPAILMLVGFSLQATLFTGKLNDAELNAQLCSLDCGDNVGYYKFKKQQRSCRCLFQETVPNILTF